MCRLGQILRRMSSPNPPTRLPPASEEDTQQDAPLCPTCAALDIHAILRNGLPREDAAPIGPLTSILDKSNSCGLVSAIVRRVWLLDRHPDADLSGIECALYSIECGSLRDPTPATRELCHRLYVLPSDRPREILAAIASARTGRALDIQVLDEDTAQFWRTDELHGRRVKATVDMRLVKRWLGLCEEAHGDACSFVWWRGDDEGLPGCVRMVDVTCMTVVHAAPACRYVALSYLWGKMGREYWTTRANVERHAAPGGLDETALPGTIRDAVLFVRQLGERYVWIDALCIVQDDPADKATQIPVVDLVYGNALLTIFAADAPLPGLCPRTRTQQQHVEMVQGLQLTVPLRVPIETLAQSAWDTHGWTYQELMLSRRRIYFTNQQGGLLSCARLYKNEYIGHYMSAIARYTQRQLTMESDIINAVTALTNALAKGFKLGGGEPLKASHFGLPVEDLNNAPLWQPRADVPRSRRMLAGALKTPWPSFQPPRRGADFAQIADANSGTFRNEEQLVLNDNRPDAFAVQYRSSLEHPRGHHVG
ncbi:heterokaryon incompatibility protein-domain-containing protein [Amylocystis lapponica]|nr:heterokaryon incompatibility protein-domain-containing protein [Amylocystis lapponica]